jgi:hypothetical protein
VVSSGVRAAAIPGASGGGAPRRATGGGTPPGSSDDNAPEAGRQASTALLNPTRLYFYGRNKALKNQIFVYMHANPFPFNSNSCHPKFMRMQ